jgi:hypothetical protein
VFRPATGAEDILLAEDPALDIDLALTLIAALGRRPDGGIVGWKSLPLPDLDAALLAMRRFFIGDHIRTSVLCGTAAGCRTPIDIAFGIGAYLAHHRPGRPAGVAPATEPGWFSLQGTNVTGRLVSCEDQMAIAGLAHAEQELARRCIRPETASARDRRKMEAAMARMAPSLFDELDGQCPECAAPVRITFDPLRYVLTELRDRAMFIYQEVDLIASRYRWSESDILAMPGARRARYAEYAQDAAAGR